MCVRHVCNMIGEETETWRAKMLARVTVKGSTRMPKSSLICMWGVVCVCVSVCAHTCACTCMRVIALRTLV